MYCAFIGLRPLLPDIGSNPLVSRCHMHDQPGHQLGSKLLHQLLGIAFALKTLGILPDSGFKIVVGLLVGLVPGITDFPLVSLLVGKVLNYVILHKDHGTLYLVKLAIPVTLLLHRLQELGDPTEEFVVLVIN